jgi:uncharacterized protein YcnI
MSASARRTLLVAAITAFLFVGAGPAYAHVTANPAEAPADSYFATAFRVGHGCEGSPTTSVRVRVPAGVVSVKPEVVPGWDAEVVEGPYEEPVELHGREVTEGVVEVTWTGGPLPDDAFTDFGLSMKLPDKAGETLYFPVVQSCEDGRHDWVEIPVDGQDEPEEPAPGITLTAADAGHGADTDGAAAEAAIDTGDAALTSAGAETGTDPVAWAGLVAGLLGLALGGAAVATRVRP